KLLLVQELVLDRIRRFRPLLLEHRSFLPLVIAMKNSPLPRALVWPLVLSAALALACPVHAAPAPAPAKKVEEKDATPYRIAHGDVLAVTFLGEPELNSGGNKVEPRGTI